ncbi:MAG: NAD-dependent epimerase/dehydratase family protein [Deltaproteobacteria bacterium]|nr:NAD-dependent epimerase/dehydratase family protein [Deltaproteobacteria bacterium]MBT6433724.1 NAD-dependent epimerase/dehydratase family protein [Deltaproteobacteria bacterium]MBT6490755.1 NAD-dependent epimerase/dehydratase family protein [Deltaproteobacteria bacterium]
MHVLITGATGFLGSHIAQELVANGHRIRALVRPSSDTQYLASLERTQCVTADLHDHKSIMPHLDTIDAVIHAAGGGKVKRTTDFYHQNTHTTQELIQSIRKTKQAPKRFILISSISAAGPLKKPVPRTETDLANPVSHYGRSKLEAESVCRSIENQLQLTIIRPPVVYGPRDSKMLKVFQGIQKGLLLKPPGKAMSIIYGPDCARAIRLCLEGNQATGSLYYVDDGDQHTWKNFGYAIRSAIDGGAKRKRLLTVRVPSGLIYWGGALNELRSRVTGRSTLVTRDKWRDGKQPYWICSSSRIQKELGFQAKTSLIEGVTETLNWYRNQGWL